MLFGAATLTTKLSVLFFYSRVFTSRSMRIATRVTLVLVVLWGIGNLLQTFLVCHIIDGTWYDFFGLALPSFIQPLVAMRPSILQARKALCCPDSLEHAPPPSPLASKARPKQAPSININSRDKFPLTTQAGMLPIPISVEISRQALFR